MKRTTVNLTVTCDGPDDMTPAQLMGKVRGACNWVPFPCTVEEITALNLDTDMIRDKRHLVIKCDPEGTDVFEFTGGNDAHKAAEDQIMASGHNTTVYVAMIVRQLDH